MASSSEDAAAARRDPPEDDATAALHDLLSRLERSKNALFDVVGAEAAVTELDRALELVPRIPEEVRSRVRLIVEAQREVARGTLQLGADGDLPSARGHFERAKELVTELAEEDTEDGDPASLELFRIGIEAKLLETTLPTVEDEQERVKLKRRHDELLRELWRRGGPSGAAFGAALELFGRAFEAFRRSTAALAVLDLEEAKRRIDEANAAIAEMESLLDTAEVDDPLVLERFAGMLRAYGPLLAGQQAYVTVLHEAIVGDVRERHVALLDGADADLRNGLERVAAAAATLERMMGQIIEPFPLEALEQSIGQLREIVGNLRRLVKEASSPKEVTRRAAPRFAVYFVLTLVAILAGARASGLVPELGGTELVTITLIALVVGAGASFGWEVAIRFVQAVPWPTGRAPKEELPPGGAESA